MRQGSIAKRYASALLQVTKEQGKVAAAQQELDALVQAFLANSNLRSAMSSPVISSTQKKAILGGILPKLGISTNVRNLTHVLIDNKRMAELPLLALIYRDLADEEEGQIRVFVTSATPLGENEAKLKAILEKSLKHKVLLELQVDPEILGGLVVRVQDRVFDASLKGELERWKEALSSEAVA